MRTRAVTVVCDVRTCARDAILIRWRLARCRKWIESQRDKSSETRAWHGFERIRRFPGVILRMSIVLRYEPQRTFTWSRYHRMYVNFALTRVMSLFGQR